MIARAVLQLADASRKTVVPGDILGRTARAALRLDDLRISEAHGLFSLRGAQLKLLALRGRFVVDGKVESDVVLEEGLVIEPAPGLELTVLEVVLPPAVLALEGDGLARQPLRDPSSLTVAPQPVLEPRYVGEADAHLWLTGDTWRVQVRGQPPRDIGAGTTIEVAGRRFRAVLDKVAGAGLLDTRLDEAHQPPLHLIARYDVVHIHREGHATVSLDGTVARVVAELASLHGNAPWEIVAGQVWPKERDRDVLRRRWDVYLARLRRRLRQAGIRPSLVRANGQGAIELHLLPHDRIEDMS